MSFRDPVERLEIIPVGWGFLSLHTIEQDKSVTIITDGGAVPSCYREAAACFRDHLENVFKSSDLLIWIISHFDYDHISLTAQLLDDTNRQADLCIIPFTYSVEACREALVHYVALLTYDLAYRAYRILVPTLPKALENILNRCRKKVLVRRGFKILYDGIPHYIFLWPDANYIGSKKVCERIRGELEERIKSKCEEDSEICDHIINEIREKLGSISGAELVEELDIMDLLRQREEVREERKTEFTARKSMWEGAFREIEDIEERFQEALKTNNLEEIKERLENVYSLAYILKSPRPVDDRTEVIIEITGPCFYRWRRHGLLPGEDVIMYLGDLDDSSIGHALHGCNCNYVPVLVPAHHGNRWHSRLSSVKAEITYLNRCDIHTSYGGLRKEYVSNKRSIIVGGHQHYLRCIF